MFLNNTFLGVRIWILLYLFSSIILFSGIVIYYFREKIRKKYYLFRYPEKTIRIYIHYPNNKFKVFYRLIPEDDFFTIKGLKYNYNDKNVITDNLFCKYDREGDYTIIIEGKKFNLIKDKIITLPKRQSVSEVHFFYNVANPMIFNCNKKVVDFTSKQLNDFKENDLFNKLLTMKETDNLIKFLLILGVGNLIATLFIIAKMLEFI